MHIIGAGGHAKVIIETLILNEVAIEGVWDDNYLGRTIFDFKVLGGIDDFRNSDYLKVIIGIGDNLVRRNLARILKDKSFGGVIHPSCNIARSTKIGNGTVVLPGCSINADAVVGNHVIVNTNASVDHDCSINDFVHISPGSSLSGGVTVGEGTHLGVGVNVIPGIDIGRWAIIGAGSTIIKDVPDYAVVVGNPGRIIKFNR